MYLIIYYEWVIVEFGLQENLLCLLDVDYEFVKSFWLDKSYVYLLVFMVFEWVRYFLFVECFVVVLFLVVKI